MKVILLRLLNGEIMVAKDERVANDLIQNLQEGDILQAAAVPVLKTLDQVTKFCLNNKEKLEELRKKVAELKEKTKLPESKL